MVIRCNKILSLVIIALFFIMLIFSSTLALGVNNGLNLSLNVVIPSLFPFTVLSIMFIKSGGFYYLSKMLGIKISIWLISAIGGYPAGALILKELENSLDKKFIKRAVFFSVNAGPSFVIYAVAINIFNNIKIGIFLLAAHLISSFLFCVFTPGSKTVNIKIPTYLPPFDLFFSSLETALKSILKICGIIIVISSFFEIIKTYDFLKYPALFLEVSVGIEKANKNLYLIAFLLSFSGLSVIMQIKMILNNYINFWLCVIYRILHGTATVFILKILLYFCPLSIPTISNGVPFLNKLNYISITSGMALIFMCLVFIMQILRQKNNREISRLEF